MSPEPNSLGRIAIVCGGASIGLMAGVAALGTSAAEVPLRGGADDWPLVAHAHPSAWIVTVLSIAAVALGAVAVSVGLSALARGWAPSPRKLLGASFLAVALLVAVPPIGSADVVDYASYGHAASHGIDPYAVSPRQQRNDPIARAVETPWRGVTSVYGPAAVGEQRLIDRLAGDRLRMTIALLALVHGAAFAIAGALLYKVASTASRRRRVVVLFGLNPVLLYAVVAGAHIDSLLVLGLVAAYVLLRKWPLAAGALGGAATLVKLSGALAVGAWALTMWRDRRRALALAAGFGSVVVAGYAVVGLHALNQARRASRYVSPATPWRTVRSIASVVGRPEAATIVSIGATLAAAALMLKLFRTLPAEDGDDGRLARAAVAVTLAWTLTTPYVLSWYDLMPVAFLALIRPSRYDRIVLAHAATLAAVYAPGRAATAVRLPSGLRSTLNVLHSGVAPVLLAVFIGLAFVPDLGERLDSWRRGRRGSAFVPIAVADA